jgi:hypothetical protein
MENFSFRALSSDAVQTERRGSQRLRYQGTNPRNRNSRRFSIEPTGPELVSHATLAFTHRAIHLHRLTFVLCATPMTGAMQLPKPQIDSDLETPKKSYWLAELKSSPIKRFARAKCSLIYGDRFPEAICSPSMGLSELRRNSSSNVLVKAFVLTRWLEQHREVGTQKPMHDSLNRS